MKITLDYIRNLINNYYRYHDAASFFEICDIYEAMKTKEINHPIMIEMSNIIVMG